MLGANLFFKKPERLIRTHEYTQQDAMRDRELRMVREKYSNVAARPTVGHPRYGFQTLLNQDSFGKLPTAPAVVGGNVNWKNSQVTPVTQHLYDSLNVGRTMNPPPALGSVLRLGEPNVNSIHTTY
jgi:hypothetical protein